MTRNDLVIVRGGGRLGTAVAHRLRLCGFPVIVTEAARPTMIHRRAAFGAAVYESGIVVEGVPARRASGPEGLREILESGMVPVLVDPAASIRESVRPWVLVDAIGLDRNVGTRRSDAPIVVALGRGFVAGPDAHAVVDPRPGQDLGRFTTEGPLRDDQPGAIWAADPGGLVHSPAVGRFQCHADIGQRVAAGVPLGQVGSRLVSAPRAGVVHGLLADGVFVGVGIRLADVDPRLDPELAAAIDPICRAAAGGVLEAILYTAAVGAEPGQSLSGRTPDGD